MFSTFALVMLALQLGCLLCVGPVHATDSTTPPQGSVNSPEMIFNLGGITSTEKKASWVQQGINYFASRIIAVIAGTAGSFAILMMSIGGILMITSAGDQTQYDKGKGYLITSAIGLVFVLGAYILVVTVQVLIKGIYG